MSKILRFFGLPVFAVGLLVAFASQGFAQNTLNSVKQRGYILCGVSQGLPGFSNPDENNNWTGIDVDVCRALSAAIFADPDKVRYVPLSAKARFTALQSGEIDVLSRNTTVTMSRDVEIGGIDFVGVNFYDGQGFMIRKALGVRSALELSGVSICTNTGTTTELNATDYFTKNQLPFELVAFEKADEAVIAYDDGRCDVYTTDQSGLAAQRTKLTNPDEHVIMPEVISKEPLGPAVREGDANWADIVRWSLAAMINAEELGVNSQNVNAMRNDSNLDPRIARLLGVSGTMGQSLGIQPDWGYQIVAHVGNYAEVYDRTVGVDTPLGLPRGVNALWTDGGILYAHPIR